MVELDQVEMRQTISDHMETPSGQKYEMNFINLIYLFNTFSHWILLFYNFEDFKKSNDKEIWRVKFFDW